MNNRIVIVISDLHIGAGVLDDFDNELESCFCDFLFELSSKNMPVELVINGDFLDFVQAPPWKGRELQSISQNRIPLCFTEEQSVIKLEEITNEHRVVFEALGEFLSAKKQNFLTILPGNHDVDFFWPKVRTVFSEKICPQSSKEQITFYLEQSYRPSNFPKILIEHGHQHDRCNSFYVDGKFCWSTGFPPIFEDIHGEKRLYECIGTRFLIKFLNELDSMYPFVDNVKPFGRFLSIFGTSALTPGYGPVKAGIAVWAMLKYLTETLTYAPSDVLENASTETPDPRPILRNIVNGLSDTECKVFIENLCDRGFQIRIPLRMITEDLDKAYQLIEFLADNPEIIPDFQEDISCLGLNAKGTLALTKGFFLDETEELVTAAKQIIKDHNLNLIIMGHTHEPLNLPQGINYINTGCWTKFYHFNRDDKQGAWSILKSSSNKFFPYQLNYVKITPDHQAHFCIFRERYDGSS